jgi:hypothetical protein
MLVSRIAEKYRVTLSICLMESYTYSYNRVLRTLVIVRLSDGYTEPIARLPTLPSGVTSPNRTLRSFKSLERSEASRYDPLLGSGM